MKIHFKNSTGNLTEAIISMFGVLFALATSEYYYDDNGYYFDDNADYYDENIYTYMTPLDKAAEDAAIKAGVKYVKYALLEENGIGSALEQLGKDAADAAKKAAVKYIEESLFGDEENGFGKFFNKVTKVANGAAKKAAIKSVEGAVLGEEIENGWMAIAKYIVDAVKNGILTLEKVEEEFGKECADWVNKQLEGTQGVKYIKKKVGDSAIRYAILLEDNKIPSIEDGFGKTVKKVAKKAEKYAKKYGPTVLKEAGKIAEDYAVKYAAEAIFAPENKIASIKRPIYIFHEDENGLGKSIKKFAKKAEKQATKYGKVSLKAAWKEAEKEAVKFGKAPLKQVEEKAEKKALDYVTSSIAHPAHPTAW